MRKYLLSESGTFYKANLHCHSTISDGKLTPEEIKNAYMAKGYSVVAYTDHNVMLDQTHLCDENFVALNGYELNANDPGAVFKYRKTCHLCLIALKPDNLRQVCWHREKYMVGNGAANRHLVQHDPNMPDFERDHSPECINTMIRAGVENGFFVTYNHPVWSLENRSDYENYHGMHAMEICNTGSLLTFPEYDPIIYDDMLRMGKRLYCIAADDNHNGAPFGAPRCDSFVAWTMIKAESLDYTSITDALLAGNFYASMGPEIKELYMEGNKLCVKTGPCEKIVMSTGCRKTRAAFREKGRSLTQAEFIVEPDDGYVRITVTDKFGRHANTNAYFVEDIL